MSQRELEHKVNRNDPCPCGSGRKTKRCCGTAGSATGPDAAQLSDLAKERVGALAEMCEDCLSEVWLEVLDLPTKHKACRVKLPFPRPPGVERLEAALRDGDTDRLADELPRAVAAVDGPEVRAFLGKSVLRLEAAGRARPQVVAAALRDLSGEQRSMLVMSALLASLSGGLYEAAISDVTVKRSPRGAKPQAHPTSRRRKSLTSGNR